MSDAERPSEEEARLRQQQDQWIAAVADAARQCKYMHDRLTEQGLSDSTAATIVGHWYAASILGQQQSGAMNNLFELIQQLDNRGEQE